MHIVVTGACGQLGNHMHLASENSSHSFSFVDIADLDLTNEAMVWSYFRHHPADVIVNCAAYTNVDRAEDEEDAADLVNHVAVRYLAETAKSLGATLIHISTDYVFGGNQNNTPFTENETPNPTGAYGRTKLAGEQAIMSSGCNYIIIRTAWLYSEFGKNFVKTILSVLDSQSSRKVVFDQVGTPTYAGDLAHAILTIIDSPGFPHCQGIYNFSNEGVCSWFDFAKEIARQVNNSSCEILPCHSSDFPSKVVRPAYSVLDKSKIKSTFSLKVPYWTDSLKLCLQKLYHEA